MVLYTIREQIIMTEKLFNRPTSLLEWCDFAMKNIKSRYKKTAENIIRESYKTDVEKYLNKHITNGINAKEPTIIIAIIGFLYFFAPTKQ